MLSDTSHSVITSHTAPVEHALLGLALTGMEFKHLLSFFVNYPHFICVRCGDFR